MRHGCIAFLFALASLASACTAGSEDGPPNAAPPATTGSGTAGSITVTLTLPSDGHSEAIHGEVTASDSRTVATFEFPPDFTFSEEPSAGNDFRPATSTVAGLASIEVELPGEDTYTFATDDSFFWGGCGTCGTLYAGGELTTNVRDGSVVEINLGEVSGRS